MNSLYNLGGRNESLDFVAGCMMLVVIFLHAGILTSYPYSIMHFLGFFMPWFFFKAGMFHKENQRYSKEFFLKLAKRFAVPMCTYFIISGGDISLLWFLAALAIAKIVFVALPKNKIALWILALLLFVIGDIINRFQPPIALLLKEIPMALFYYTIGFQLKKINCNLKMIVILSLIYLLIIFLIPSRVDMRMQTILFGYFEIAVIGCLVGIVLMNAICTILVNFLPQPITFIGRESMIFYLLHRPIIKATESLITTGLTPVISVLLIVPIIIIITNKLKLGWIFGKV